MFILTILPPTNSKMIVISCRSFCRGGGRFHRSAPHGRGGQRGADSLPGWSSGPEEESHLSWQGARNSSTFTLTLKQLSTYRRQLHCDHEVKQKNPFVFPVCLTCSSARSPPGLQVQRQSHRGGLLAQSGGGAAEAQTGCWLLVFTFNIL